MYNRNFEYIEIEGLPFANFSMKESIGFILDEIMSHRGGWVITPNLDILRRWVKDADFREMANHASLFVADGMPIIWISYILDSKLPERVAGSDLFVNLCKELSHKRKSVLFLGGATGAAEGAADYFRIHFPELRVCQPYVPPFGFEKNEEEFEKIKKTITYQKPDVVFVGLGCPKQEYLINRLHIDFPKIWFLGVGVSFSFISGDVKRAPLYIQRFGLEWLHRFLQEPKRLAKRYFIDDFPFAIYLSMKALKMRFFKDTSI